MMIAGPNPDGSEEPIRPPSGDAPEPSGAHEDPGSLWAHVQAGLRARFGSSIERWLGLVKSVRRLPAREAEGDQPARPAGLGLMVESTFARDWIQSRYLEAIQEDLKLRHGVEGPVELEVRSPESEATRIAPALHLSGKVGGNAPGPRRIPASGAPSSPRGSAPGAASRSPLSRLDQLVTGPSNQLAVSALRQILAHGSRVFNPLYLHGGTGVGKTELLRALREDLLAGDPGLRIVSLEAETFLNQFVVALKEGKLSEFRGRFRALDLLIIDDFQALARKNRTQEEVTFTLDQLRSSGCQIVIAASCSPRRLEDFSAALKSRLISGLVAPIKKPDLPMRREIITRQARRLDLDLSDAVLGFIAETLRGNVRDLLGALNQVAAHQMTSPEPLSVERVSGILCEQIEEDRRSITPERICEAVSRYFHLDAGALVSRRRDKTVSVARRVAIHLCRESTDHSLSELGRYFGKRDGATLRAADRRVREDLAAGGPMVETLQNVRELLSG